MPPEQAQPATAAAQTPLYQVECWNVPKGNFGAFGYRKCTIVVYPGWLLVYRNSTHAEVLRVQLTPDVQFKSFLGFTRISFVAGQKIGMMKQNYSFLMAPIWAFVLIMVGVLFNLVGNIIDLNNAAAGIRTNNIFFLGVGLALGLIGFAWLAIAGAKVKTFVQACKHAAGIA